MRSHNCPKCQGSMAEGFVVENNQGMNRVNGWVGGAPEKGIFGVKLRGRPQYDIQTWRCGRCGFLESYAAA